MKKLELPVTIRLATKDDVPNETEILSNIIKGEGANIVEGYIIHQNNSHDLPFNFFSEININNSRVWDLFDALIKGFPSVACLVYGHIDADPFYSKYIDKSLILEKTSQYKKELSQDGFLEFGMLYQDDDKLIEVFVKKAKYIQYWGTNESFFIKVMNDFALQYTEEINFVDEFPVVTESLSLYDSEALCTEDLINILNRNLQ
ncbi:MAG: hypothetical protein V4581_13055 [Bacteroidota bacterium]